MRTARGSCARHRAASRGRPPRAAPALLPSSGARGTGRTGRRNATTPLKLLGAFFKGEEQTAGGIADDTRLGRTFDDMFTTRAFTMKLADPANKPVEDYYDEARLDVQRELLAMANTSEAEFQESKRRRAHQLAEEDGKTKGDNHYYFQARGFCATLWCTRCACAVCK
mmetsp:Transcript_41162/g.102800  ORF Transcript_41162/g.102800 Transcript_41162/m.102800 type:complete len:168 (-) Transcript_41162:101-604(-)